MDSLIFLATLQLPFIYLFWRFFKRREGREGEELRSLRKQVHQTQTLFETLRSVSDKNRESLQKRCDVLEEENSRLKVTLHRYSKFYEERLRELERCSGISPSASLASSSFLKDKDFS